MTARAARRNAERWARNSAKREQAQLVAAAPTKEPRRDGLEWLRDKRQISHEEHLAGVWYADRYRWAHLGGAVPMPSCLAGGTGGGADAPPRERLEVVEYIAAARADFAAIEARIGWDADMKLTLLSVCVRGERLSEETLGRTERAVTVGRLRATLGHIAQLRKERSQKAA